MSEAVVVALIEIAPVALTVSVVFVVAVFKWKAIQAALGRVTRVSVAGVEFDLDPEVLRQARPDAPISRSDAEGVVRRAERIHATIRGKRVLWVDDHPRNNDAERAFLREAGLDVSNALTTDEALDDLRRDQFDVVVTDMDRGNGDDGLLLAKEIMQSGESAPVICYLGVKDPARPVPAEFYGLTDRPDELVDLVFDTLEGRRRKPC